MISGDTFVIRIFYVLITTTDLYFYVLRMYIQHIIKISFSKC